VPWSWIIVRVFKAKSGGYPKVNGPTEFFPGDAHSRALILKNQKHSTRSDDSCPRVYPVGGVIGESETIMQIVPRRQAGGSGQDCSPRHRSGGIGSNGGRAHHGGQPATERLSVPTLIGGVDPRSVIELELVHRLASLLWRLRRASAIETGLFEIQGELLLGPLLRTQSTGNALNPHAGQWS